MEGIIAEADEMAHYKVEWLMKILDPLAVVDTGGDGATVPGCLRDMRVTATDTKVFG